ncbi:hypothetical protein SCB29_22650 [Paraburkholderia sp. SIMBA_055]
MQNDVNGLTTATFTYSDIDNHAAYSGQQIGVSASTTTAGLVRLIRQGLNAHLGGN